MRSVWAILLALLSVGQACQVQVSDEGKTTALFNGQPSSLTNLAHPCYCKAIVNGCWVQSEPQTTHRGTEVQAPTLLVDESIPAGDLVSDRKTLNRHEEWNFWEAEWNLWCWSKKDAHGVLKEGCSDDAFRSPARTILPAERRAAIRSKTDVVVPVVIRIDWFTGYADAFDQIAAMADLARARVFPAHAQLVFDTQGQPLPSFLPLLLAPYTAKITQLHHFAGRRGAPHRSFPTF